MTDRERFEELMGDMGVVLDKSDGWLVIAGGRGPKQEGRTWDASYWKFSDVGELVTVRID